MPSAINNLSECAEFQKNHQAPLRDYELEGRKIGDQGATEHKTGLMNAGVP
jgi:hypothetical protein